MSQTLLQKAFGVSRHYQHVRTDFDWGGVQFFLDLKSQALVCPQCRLVDQVIRKATAVPLLADCADRPKAGLFAGRGGALPVPALRCHLRGSPPFAPVRRIYPSTRGIWGAVEPGDDATRCRRTGCQRLFWDSVKVIAKRRLRRDYERLALKGVRYLSIDEIYMGKRRGYYTLVLDLESGAQGHDLNLDQASAQTPPKAP